MGATSRLESEVGQPLGDLGPPLHGKPLNRERCIENLSTRDNGSFLWISDR